MTYRRLVPCLFLALWASAAQAQTPCPADVNQHAGAWRPRASPQSPAQFRAPAGSYNRATADATLETILGLFRAAYPQPTGTMAYFNKNLTFSTPYRARPFGYSLYMGFAGFQCTSAGTLAELGESGVFINVDVNSLEGAGFLMPVAAPSMQTPAGEVQVNAAGTDEGQYTIGGRRVFLMPADAGTHRGVDHYTRREYGGNDEPPDWQWFVVRRPDVPVVIPVTRREYVQQFRRELESFTSSELAVQRAWARQTGDESVRAHAEAFARSQAAYLQAVDEYLQRATEEELARPVHELLMFFPRDPDHPGVDFREGDRVMAWLNPAYLDPTLPHHVPQLIVIRLSARAGRYPWEAHLRDRFSNGLDFDTLRALVGR